MKKTFFKNNKKRILAFLTSISMMPVVAMPVFASSTPSFDIPTNVTNVGKTAEMIKVTFDGSVDIDALEVKAVTQEAKDGVFAEGAEYPVGVVEKNEAENSFCIDIAGLPSGIKFKIDVDGTTSEEFTTGLVANVPYKKDTAIVDLIAEKSATISSGVYVNDALNAELAKWIDNNLDTQFNFTKDSYNNNYAVIDLGDVYEVEDVAMRLTGTMWHSGGQGAILKETLDGVNYNSLARADAKLLMRSVDNYTKLYPNIVDHVDMGGSSENARYILLKDISTDSQNDFIFRDVYVFGRVRDSFGEWTITDNYPDVEFDIPFTYATTPKTYTMQMTTYDNGVINVAETPVTGTNFHGAIEYTTQYTTAQAVIYDTESHKIVAPIAYWRFDGYAKNNGTAATFENAVSGLGKNESFVVSGKSVEETDYITVSAVNAYEDVQTSTEYADAETAFANEDIVWQASTASGDGYEIEVPLSGGKYFIRVIRYANDKTEEVKYFSHKIIGDAERAAFVEAAMTGDATAVETAVVDGLADEIITNAGLADASALEDDNFYANYIITREMLYEQADIDAIIAGGAVDSVVKLLDSAAAVNYILAGDFEEAVNVIDAMADSSEIEEYVIPTADVDSFNSIFVILKSDFLGENDAIDSAKLGKVIKWSGMLASLQGTDAENADALADFDSDLGIDVTDATDNGLALENVVSNMNFEITSENILALYTDFAAAFETAVAKEAAKIRINFTIPEGSVTNVGRGLDLIKVYFSGPVNMTEVTPSTVYAVALETKGNITAGTQYSVGIIENEADEKSVMIDIAGLPSYTQFKMVVDGILAEKIESETFTTGLVANIPYVKDTAIFDVIEGLETSAISPGVETTQTHSLSTWIDRDSTTSFNFNGGDDKFGNNYVVIDLGRKYEISDLAAQIPGQAWHSGGTRFYLAETLEGITYDTLTDGMSLTISNADNGTPIFDGMVDHAVMSEAKEARYVILKENKSGSNYDFILKEVFAFARVSDSFGDWEVVPNGNNLQFEIPFMYANEPKTFTMKLTTYKADKTVLNTVESTVTGDLFASTISSVNAAYAQAIIYDGESYKVVSPIAYWGFEGYAKENGTAAKFQDAVTGTPKKESFVVSGKSVLADDSITVEVANIESPNTVVWYANTVSGNGYEIEIPFVDTNKYAITVIRYAKDGTKETKAFTYQKAAADVLNTFVDTLMAGGADSVKAAVESAIASEIIAESYLLDASALDGEDFYKVYEYTRDMIYEDSEKTDIATNDTLEDVVDTLNAAIVINAIWNGDDEAVATLLQSDAAQLIDGLTDKVQDVESYNKTFVALKSEITSAETLEEIIDWSEKLAPMYGTDEEISQNMRDYETEFGIDLSVIDDKGLSIDRVSSYMKPETASDVVAMYTDFNTVFEAAVASAEDEKNNAGSGSGNVTNNDGTGNNIYQPGVKPIVSGGSSGSGGGAVVIPTPVVKAPTFSDMSAYGWANDAVSKLVNNKVLNGYTDGTFRPEANVTRGEFIKMLVAATKVEVVENKSMFFLDVAEDSWYFPYIKIAYTNRLCQGVSDGYFDPQGYITRQDMAVLIYNYMKFAKMSTSGEAKAFTDEASIAGYAKEAVEHASAAGVINGRDDGTFAPLANARRVDAAMMISKIMK